MDGNLLSPRERAAIAAGDALDHEGDIGMAIRRLARLGLLGSSGDTDEDAARAEDELYSAVLAGAFDDDPEILEFLEDDKPFSIETEE